MTKKENQEQEKTPFKIGGDSSLGFEKELEIVESLFDYEDEELLELLEQHPDALLLHKGVVDERPKLIFELENTKPEVYLQLFYSKEITPFCTEGFEEEIANWIFENEELATKRPDVAKLLYFQALNQFENFSYKIEKNKELMDYALLSNKDFSRNFQYVNDKEAFSPLVLKKVILDNPKMIRFLPNASEELKELAILADPSSIHLINHPSEHLKKMAISLDNSLVNSIEELSDESKWFALIKNDQANLKSIQEPNEEMEQYALMSHPESISDLKEPTDYQKLLALKLDYESFNSMKDLSKEMVNFMVRVNPDVLKLMDFHKKEWYELALNKRIDYLSKLKGDKRYLFELALEVVKKESFLSESIIEELFANLPSSRLDELENDLERIATLIENVERLDIHPTHESRWNLPFKLPHYQFEKLFSKFPYLLKISRESIDDDNLPLMRENPFAFKQQANSSDKERLLLQQQFVSKEIERRISDELLDSKFSQQLVELIVENAVEPSINECFELTNHSYKTWSLIKKNPFNLAIVPMRNRSFRLCRLAGRLNKEALLFSPFHLDDVLEETNTSSSDKSALIKHSATINRNNIIWIEPTIPSNETPTNEDFSIGITDDDLPF